MSLATEKAEAEKVRFAPIPGTSAYKVLRAGAVIGEVYPTESKHYPWVAVGHGSAQTRAKAAEKIVRAIEAGHEPAEERWP